MAEEEHEVYGAEIPDEAEMDGDFDHDDMSTAQDDDDDDAAAVVKEEEAAALREMQTNAAKEMSSAQDPATGAVSQANKEVADECSVYVGNADCYPQRLYV
ncbi:hypothetical protein ACLB2K_001684 [Fragaria x ananassa]